MNSEFVPEPEHEEDNNNKSEIEDAAFPIEFLDCMAETSFLTVMKYFKGIKLPKDVTDLLDIMYCLNLEQMSLIKSKGKADNFSNELIKDYVSQASCLIVKLGGVFYTETGSVTPLQTELNERTQQQIENILQQSNAKIKKPKRNQKKR